MHNEEWERRETAEELAVVIRLAQEMAQRLASETHGVLHGEVVALGNLLRQARHKVEFIENQVEKHSMAA
jgi:hypothetical protein